MNYKTIKLKEVLKHRKGNILIDDDTDYKLCRVQVHRKGVVLRQIVKGGEIRTKKQQVCKSGDFIVAEMDAKYGGYGIIPQELDGAIVSSHYYLFEVNEEKLSKDFLTVLSQTDIIQSQIKAKGSTNYSSVRPNEVLEFEIPLLSLEEQYNIVKKYKYVSEHKITLQTELKTQASLLTKLRQAYLQEAVMGQLTASTTDDAHALLADIKAQKAQLIKEGKLRKEKPLPPIKPEEIPFEIPKNWVWCRLGEICNTITKGSSPKWQGVQYVDSPEKGILFITSKNVDSFTIDLSNVTYVEAKFNEIEPRSVLKKGDLLTNIVGASIGRTALYNLDYIANINQAVCILRIEHEFINKSYLLNLLNSSFVINQMFESQFAPGRANLSMGDIATFPIPLPPLSEQQAIVAKVEGLLKMVSTLEAENKAQQAELERLMSAVLQESFSTTVFQTVQES